MGQFISTWWLDLVIANKKDEPAVEIAFSDDHRVKLKKREKRDKCPEFARGLYKLWNEKVMVIQIVIIVLGTVSEEFVQGLEDFCIRG